MNPAPLSAAGGLRTVSGAPVFPLGLGGAGIGSSPEAVFFGRPLDDAQALATVQHALARGINLLDTSPFYGASERRLGLALRAVPQRERLFLSTKVGTHPEHRGYDADSVRRSIDASRRALGTDYLDLVHIHDPAPADFTVALAAGGALEALRELQAQGVIRHLGLGVRDHALHRRFIATGQGEVILPYLDYNLLNQSAAALLSEAAAAGVQVMLGSPLCMGLLGGADPATLRISHYAVEQDVSLATAQAMYAWCQSRGCSLPAFNFHFIRRHPAIGAVVVGAASPAEIDASLAAWHAVIDARDFDAFCAAFFLPCDRSLP